MTKKHFIAAAYIVRAIRDGNWTSELPAWVRAVSPTELDGNVSVNHVRAVWTAEAFIHLAQQFNPRFDRTRFLIVCGLVAAPVKKGKA